MTVNEHVYTMDRVPTPPGKSWKMDLVLESPGNISGMSWKVLKFLLGYDAEGRRNGVGVGANAEICACAHLY